MICVTDTEADQAATATTSDDDADMDDAEQPLDLSFRTSPASLVTSQHKHDQRTFELDVPLSYISLFSEGVDPFPSTLGFKAYLLV